MNNTKSFLLLILLECILNSFPFSWSRQKCSLHLVRKPFTVGSFFLFIFDFRTYFDCNSRNKTSNVSVQCCGKKFALRTYKSVSNNPNGKWIRELNLVMWSNEFKRFSWVRVVHAWDCWTNIAFSFSFQLFSIWWNCCCGYGCGWLPFQQNVNYNMEWHTQAALKLPINRDSTFIYQINSIAANEPWKMMKNCEILS